MNPLTTPVSVEIRADYGISTAYFVFYPQYIKSIAILICQLLQPLQLSRALNNALAVPLYASRRARAMP